MRPTGSFGPWLALSAFSVVRPEAEDHSSRQRDASARPSPAATPHTTTVPAVARSATPVSPFSRRRTISTLKAENVVYAPQKPVPRTTLGVSERPWYRADPVITPSRNDPVTFTTNVPDRAAPWVRSLTYPSTR